MNAYIIYANKISFQEENKLSSRIMKNAFYKAIKINHIFNNYSRTFQNRSGTRRSFPRGRVLGDYGTDLFCLTDCANPNIDFAGGIIVTNTPTAEQLSIADICDFLKYHEITVTGGMNLARAPWNNPALNGLIDVTQLLIQGDWQYGMVHGNGGIGEAQGITVLEKSFGY